MAKRVQELYDDTFQEELRGNDLVFVDFYADWCGPCKAVAPVVERVAKEFEGRIAFGRLNTEGNPETASRYRVTSIPTLILFRDGKSVTRLQGFQPDAALRANLERYAPAVEAGEAPIADVPAARGGGLFSRMFGRRP